MSAVPSAFRSFFLPEPTPGCRFPMFSPTRRYRGDPRRLLPPPSGLRFAARSRAIAGMRRKTTPDPFSSAQFWCAGFKAWCRRREIRPRFGAVGKHGSIAVIERAILTMKQLVGGLPVVPLRREIFRRDLSEIIAWYNEHRPHTSLRGRTPNEVYFNRRPASRAPRWEPRREWPRSSPCAEPRTLIKGQPGVCLQLDVSFHAGRSHLPIVSLKRAA